MPDAVGRMVVEMLDLGEDDRNEQVTALKRMVRG